MRALSILLVALFACDVEPDTGAQPLPVGTSDDGEPDVGPYECHPMHAACEPGFACVAWSGAFECMPATGDAGAYADCEADTDCAHGLACIPNNDIYPGFKGCFAWCEAWDAGSCGGSVVCTQEPELGSAADVLDLGVCVP